MKLKEKMKRKLLALKPYSYEKIKKYDYLLKKVLRKKF